MTHPTPTPTLSRLEEDWCDRYGPIPTPAQQLIRVMELKQIAKKLGFSRIKPDSKQHVILETPMEEPAWNLLKQNLADHLKTRFVYSPGKITIRGLGVMNANKQLESLVEWLDQLENSLSETAESVV